MPGYLSNLWGAFRGRAIDGVRGHYADDSLGYGRRTARDEDKAVRFDRELTRLTIMDMRRNYPLVISACNRITDFCAGPVGLLSQSATDDDKWNDAADAFFKDWAKACDALGRLSFGDFQRILIDATLYAGDCLIMRLKDGTIQGVEGEHIRQPRNVQDGAAEYDGMRLDGAGRLAQFCIHKRGPGGDFPGVTPGKDYNWLDAGLVWHWTSAWRFDSIRALPELACGINIAKDIKDANDSTLKQVRAQAKPAMATETFTGNLPPSGRSGGRTRAESGSKDRVEELEAATVYHLLQGEGGLKFAAPATPNANFKPFLEWNARQFCAITGFAYEFIAVDLTGGNFSQNKTAKHVTQRAIETKQARLRAMCNNIRAWRIAKAIERRELPPAPVVNGRSQFADCLWVPPPQDWADADEQARTDIMEIEAGLATYTEKTGRRQKDLEEVWRQRAAEIKMLKKIAAEYGVEPSEIARFALPGAAPAENPVPKTEGKPDEE